MKLLAFIGEVDSSSMVSRGRNFSMFRKHASKHAIPSHPEGCISRCTWGKAFNRNGLNTKLKSWEIFPVFSCCWAKNHENIENLDWENYSWLKNCKEEFHNIAAPAGPALLLLSVLPFSKWSHVSVARQVGAIPIDDKKT